VKTTMGFLFGVLFTEDGLSDGLPLGYQVVLTDRADDNHRVIVHTPGATPMGTRIDVRARMQASLEWAQHKYPDYVLDTVRVRKGQPVNPEAV
jgi:hypothetical protein